MTNAERFIGDEDEIDTFIEEFCDFAVKLDKNLDYHRLKEHLVKFFQSPAILTEDGRILY